MNSKRKMQKMEGFGFALTKEVVERNYLKMLLRFTPSFLFLTYALNTPTTSDTALN